MYHALKYEGLSCTSCWIIDSFYLEHFRLTATLSQLRRQQQHWSFSMKLFSIPYDIWLDIKDFLVPSDIENILDTGRGLWQQIFKDPSWIDTAVKSGQSSPVLIGHNLSSFRSRKSSNCLYLSLVVNDISGDLRDTSQTFFSTLQNGWRYDKEKFEVYFSSGITFNIYDIINGDETIKLPLERIFTNKKRASTRNTATIRISR